MISIDQDTVKIAITTLLGGGVTIKLIDLFFSRGERAAKTQNLSIAGSINLVDASKEFMDFLKQDMKSMRSRLDHQDKVIQEQAKKVSELRSRMLELERENHRLEMRCAKLEKENLELKAERELKPSKQ